MSVIPQASKNYVGFDPRSIPGCALWLDAADPSSFTPSYPTNETAISQWNDKSGNSRHATQGTTNNRPVYSSSDVSIDTTTNPRFFNLASMPSSPYDIFIVAKPISSNTNWRTLFRTSTADPGMNVVVLQAGTNNLGYWTSTAFSQFGSYTWSPSTRNLLFVRMNSNKTINASLNGDLSLTSATSAGTASDVILYMGALVNNGSVSQQWGNINEVIFYNSALTTTQRQQVEGYLANKWGLRTNLPASHPYKTIPIFTRPFQPTDITGCALWLDAADPSTLTLSGSNVTQWNDKSGNGNNATGPTGTIQINQVLQNNYTTVSFAANSGFSYNIVYSSTIRAVFGVIVNAGSVTTNNANYQLIGTSTLFIGLQSGTYGGNYEFNRSGNNLLVTNGLSNFFGTTSIVSATNSTVTKGIYINGNAQTISIDQTGSFSFNTGTANIRIANGAQPINIAELILIDGSISIAQRQQIEGYLANKWGLRGRIPSNHPFKLFPAITPLFTPLQISNCQVWLDAADASTLTLSGSNVTQWNDKSGNGNNATASIGNTTYANSSVVFSGSQQFNTPISWTTLNTHTFFGVARTSSTSPQDLIATRNTANTQNSGLQLYVFNNIQYLQPFGAPPFVTGGTITSGSTFIYGATYNGTSSTFTFLNGTQSGSGTGRNLVSGGILTIGAYTDGGGSGEYFNGPIYEILIFNSVLSIPQRQQIEGYLANKWGLKNSLPSTHPFKTISP